MHTSPASACSDRKYMMQKLITQCSDIRHRLSSHEFMSVCGIIVRCTAGFFAAIPCLCICRIIFYLGSVLLNEAGA